MPYYQCHDCMKIVHIDAESSDTCPVCSSENGEVLTDEEHNTAVKEGYLFHDDTD
jgi:Zn finger protein HypA/HybF involved in hydrogenase expression